MSEANTKQTITVIFVEQAVLFELGEIYLTQGAKQVLQDFNVLPATLIARHVTGDWSNMDEEDKRANKNAVKHGDRVLSSYRLHKENDYDDMVKIWVITEWDRSATTILLPSEY